LVLKIGHREYIGEKFEEVKTTSLFEFIFNKLDDSLYEGGELESIKNRINNNIRFYSKLLTLLVEKGLEDL